MPMLMPRERVIETFVSKKLAKPSEPMIHDSKVYQARQGRCDEDELYADIQKPIPKWYEEYLSEIL